MPSLTLAPNTFLNDYILNAQFHKVARLSKNAFKFWKKCLIARYGGSRTIFLRKDSIPLKYYDFIQHCDDLSGFVLASAFCSFTSLSPSHLVKKNNSQIYHLLEIKEICGVKLVNLRSFYDMLHLSYDKYLYIEKCHFFSPTPLEKRIRLTSSLCVGYY